MSNVSILDELEISEATFSRWNRFLGESLSIAFLGYSQEQIVQMVEQGSETVVWDDVDGLCLKFQSRCGEAAVLMPLQQEAGHE